MKRILLLTIIITCMIAPGVKAQYVTIPDAQFKTFLQNLYPSCFNASGQMDTTCAAIVNEDSLTITNTGILDLDGLRYFKNLLYLNGGPEYMSTNNIPELPSTLQYFAFSGGNMSTLPALPGGLIFFSIGGNWALDSLPALPAGLQYFYCNGCEGLTSFPVLPNGLLTLSFTSNTQIRSFINLPNSLKNLDFSYSRIAFTSYPSQLDSIRCAGCDLNTLFAALPPNLTYLECGYNRLSNLPALPATLKHLGIGNNAFIQLPALPASLESFDCSYNHDNMNVTPTQLPALPAGLKVLNCRGNFTIGALPALPVTLTSLYCDVNSIQILPALPDGLINLDCHQNLLTSLPALPSSLLSLSFYNNKIRSLPPLPNTLRNLNCGQNPLYTLPQTLPDSLRNFSCFRDSLSVLPALPSQLESFYCGDNQLTSLPSLPPGLTFLSCEINKLTSLPTLPSTLIGVSCYGNDIYCLPRLPSVVEYNFELWIDADRVSCLPNYPSTLTLKRMDSVNGIWNQVSLPILPLCSPVNNVSHCASFPIMHGVVFYDNNLNGTKDAGEPVKQGGKIFLSNGRYTFTDNQGQYEMAADSLGTYTISSITPEYFSAVPASYNYNFTSYDTLVVNNFALQANTVKDSLNIDINTILRWARPGFSFPYLISYENAGTTTLSPTVTLDYDETKLTYDSSSNAAITDNGTNLSLTAGTIVPGQQENFVAYFKVKPGLTLGDSLLATVSISDNAIVGADSSKVVIRASFDPNDKQATPELSPLQVINGTYIDYTIRFQNTGNDTAFNVVISDTLADELLVNTFEMTGSSHTCKTTIKDNVVFFEFLNILLPDSIVNEPKSHGFVSFRIKPNPSVPSETTINNKAAIYFDYNAPVVTNIAGTFIKPFAVVPMKLILFSAVPQNDNTVSLYWNTANEINTKHFVIERSNDGYSFSSVTSVAAKGRMNNNYNAVVTDLNNAIVFYRLKMVDNDGSFTYSPIIKIDRRKNTSGIAVLTNPVKDFLIISTSDKSLNNTQANIINMQGAVVKTFIVREGSQAVEIKNLPTGIYYIRSATGSQKILLQ